MKQKLFTLLTLLVMCVTGAWANGTITAAATTDLGSGKTPRYVVEEAGVGRLMKNKAGSSSWTLSNTSYLQTGSNLFALQTYNSITEIIVHGYGTGSGRTFSKLEVGTTTSNYAEVSATGSGTMSGTASDQTITITPSSAISADSYVAITFSGNINIASVEFVYAPTTKADAPTFNPDGGAVNGGSTVSLTSDALNVYYQWSATEADLTTASEGWISGTSVTVPNEGGTKYLYAYATNGTGLESEVVHKAFTITAVSNFKWGLTQEDLTTSTGISTTTTYTGENVSFVASNAAMSGSSSTRSLKHGSGDAITAAATACQRNNLCSGASDFVEASYYAFTITPATGYKLNISKIFGDLYYDSSRSGKYKFAVYSGDTKLWEAGSSDYVTIGGTNDSQKTLDVSGVSALQSLTGAIQVRMVWYQGGSSSYVALKDFNIEASLEELSGTKYTVTTSVNDETMGSVTATAEYVEGLNAIITATANDTYRFSSWTIDGVENASTQNPYTFSNIESDHTIQAVFAALKSVNFDVTAEQKGTRTDVLRTEYADANDKFTAPANKYLSSANQTFTGWSDGTNNYAAGAEIDLSAGNKTLTPVFADNAGADFAATLAASKSDFAVTWSFAKADVDFAIENQTAYYVKQATINNTTVDIPMFVDAASNYVVETSQSKVNNANRTDSWAQTNKGTIFRIPVVDGSVVTMNTYAAFSTTTINGVTTYTKSNNDKTATYTYSGATGTIDIVLDSDVQYTSSISVTYPSSISAKPTVTSAFNFENKVYAVTITSVEGVTNIQTSTDDGATWTDNTEFTENAIKVNVTAGQTLKARAIVGNKTASEEVNFINSLDNTKEKFIAYVYQKGYSDSDVNYDFATDELATGLAADYNVVPVELAQTDDPTAITDMDKADLIILTEAVKGSNTSTDLSNKMKEYVGTTPMIGMKVFAYTYNSDASKNRWGWGKASNHAGVNTFMPKDNTYKIFDGVVFEADGSIKLATATSGNIIQSVDFTTPETPLSPNTIMGTVGTDDKKAVIHTTTKYLGLGISCNVRESYTPNLITIVKNAAAILIANGDLTAKAEFDKKVTGTITVSGWNSFSSVFPLDLNTITATNEVAAYYASKAAGSFVTMTETDATVPAGEGLMIKGTAGDEFLIDVVASGTAIDGNLLVGLPNGGKVTKDDNNYVFAWPTATPADCGFYLIDDVEPTLPAGKAYLHTSTALTSRELSISFDAGTTGINAIDNGQLTIDTNAPMYNLAGQRVNKSYKGVVIVNGKKMLNK